jgi:hypothetical protein
VTLAGLEVPALHLLEPVLAFGTDVVILAGAEVPTLPLGASTLVRHCWLL